FLICGRDIDSALSPFNFQLFNSQPITPTVAGCVPYVYLPRAEKVYCCMSELTENEKEPLQSPAPASQEDTGGSFEADGPMEISPEEIAELRAQADKAAENWDKYVRLNADFDNFKKRAARERQEAIRYANEGLLEKLIPILDNFEMAMQAATAPQATSDA